MQEQVPIIVHYEYGWPQVHWVEPSTCLDQFKWFCGHRDAIHVSVGISDIPPIHKNYWLWSRHGGCLGAPYAVQP